MPETILVASPPFRPYRSIRIISPAKARGVMTARNRAVFLGPRGPEGSACMESLGPLASSWPLFNTYALRTVTMPIAQNKGHACRRMEEVSRPAAPAEMAGAP